MHHEVIQKVQNFHLSVSLALTAFEHPARPNSVKDKRNAAPGLSFLDGQFAMPFEFVRKRAGVHISKHAHH